MLEQTVTDEADTITTADLEGKGSAASESRDAGKASLLQKSDALKWIREFSPAQYVVSDIVRNTTGGAMGHHQFALPGSKELATTIGGVQRLLGLRLQQKGDN